LEPDETKPFVKAEEIQQITNKEAIAFADEHLGDASKWHSSPIKYRLEADFQKDWKSEVGHWLYTAKQYGFIDTFLKRLISRANQEGIKEELDRDPNDQLHTILFQDLAPAMAVHYFLGIGWEFIEWEPNSPTGTDIDIKLKSPSNKKVVCQVKGSDLPGRRTKKHRIINGENNQWVIKALDKAAKQLPKPAVNASMIIICPNRVWPMNVGPLVSSLYGTTQHNSDTNTTFLRREKTARFFTDEWTHIGAVTQLHLLRSVDVTGYGCRTLINPNAGDIAALTFRDYPRCRVLHLDGNKFRWQGVEPENSTFPNGTILIK
jgi:hypothetical protein